LSLRRHQGLQIWNGNVLRKDLEVRRRREWRAAAAPCPSGTAAAAALALRCGRGRLLCLLRKHDRRRQDHDAEGPQCTRQTLHSSHLRADSTVIEPAIANGIGYL